MLRMRFLRWENRLMCLRKRSWKGLITSRLSWKGSWKRCRRKYNSNSISRLRSSISPWKSSQDRREFSTIAFRRQSSRLNSLRKIILKPLQFIIRYSHSERRWITSKNLYLRIHSPKSLSVQMLLNKWKKSYLLTKKNLMSLRNLSSKLGLIWSWVCKSISKNGRKVMRNLVLNLLWVLPNSILQSKWKRLFSQTLKFTLMK